jgi:hypothetical protein
VQKVREAAARTQCENNLKQIGLGCQNMVNTVGYFPCSAGWYPGQGAAVGNGFGTLFFHLLPYIEQNSLYESASFTGATFDGDNPSGSYFSGEANIGQGQAFVGAQVVRTFVCRADPTYMGSGPMTTTSQYSGQTQLLWAPSCYAANARIFGVWSTGYTFSPAYSTYAMITDGLSNTCLFAERYANCDGTKDSTAGGLNRACLWDWVEPKALAGHDQWPLYANYSDPNGNAFPLPQIQPPVGYCDCHAPNTGHAGGVVVGLCDGSVRIVTSRVSQATWQAANTPAGDDILMNDWN